MGKEHSDIATMYNDIALVYRRQGDYPKALEWYLMIYKILRLKLGDTSPSTVTVMDNMKNAYQNTIHTEEFDVWLKKSSGQ